MRLFEKTIASLLVICMMFSSIPVELLTQVYGFGDGDTTTHSSAGMWTDAAGAMILGHPIVRVTLSRSEINKYDGTSATKEATKNIYNTRYPERQPWTNSLFFVDNRGDWNHLNTRINIAKNNGGKVYFGKYEFNAASLNSGNPLHVSSSDELTKLLLPTTPTGSATNTFQQKVTAAKNAKTINSTDDLANYGWKNYLLFRKKKMI